MATDTSANQESKRSVFKSSSLRFPRPHQLGSSSGLHLSRASAAVHPHHPLPTPDHNIASVITPQLAGQDEVDFQQQQGGPPICTPLLKRKGLAKPVVKTFNERPLKELTLYLPPKLPNSIVDTKLALSDFVITTSVSYVTMWELANELRVLNLRFPAQYVEKLASDCSFLNVFLQNVFDQLSEIKSIKELVLPEISLHSPADLSLILQPIIDSSFSISRLVLPVSSGMCENDLKQADLKTIASQLRKSNAKSVTLLSSDDIISVLADKLSCELKRYRKNSPNVSYSEGHLKAPGPQYITDMSQPVECGEAVDPGSLVDSLNTTPAAAAAEHRTGTLQHATQQHKATKKVRQTIGIATIIVISNSYTVNSLNNEHLVRGTLSFIGVVCCMVHVWNSESVPY